MEPTVRNPRIESARLDRCLLPSQQTIPERRLVSRSRNPQVRLNSGLDCAGVLGRQLSADSISAKKRLRRKRPQKQRRRLRQNQQARNLILQQRNPVFDQQRRRSENQRSRDSESSYPRFPSIVGALIIAASILLSALMFAAGTRFTAVETSNEDVAWLVDRLSGNLYKCRAAEQGKATCEAETATGSIGQKAKR